MTLAPSPHDPLRPLTEEDLAELSELLADLSTRDEETPSWDFFEGALAALVCCRRKIAPSEYLPVLLHMNPQSSQPFEPFADEAQYQRFGHLWLRRMLEVATALSADVDSLHDEAAYFPLIQDLRAEVAALAPEERAQYAGLKLPALGQIWAIGFMFVVESWPHEWEIPPTLPPDAIQQMDEAMQAIMALTEADPEPADTTAAQDAAQQREVELGEALWAVYDLYALWRQIGPRVESVRRASTPGRNDPCPCGSGKKYKKCCGAG